ncbi:MAG TPA: ATP-binding protein [Verrucomicrobiae bacterium]|nr:ATP-binding protein [Verrucomicrobiae bacterium]
MVTLESCALFEQLPAGEMADLRAAAATRAYSPGQDIFKEGDPGDGIYVVSSGKVAISARLIGGDRRVFSEVLPSDFFGEMAVLDQLPRSANATAAEPTEVFFIPREKVVKLLTHSPSVGMALLQEICRRMREFNQQYFREVLQAERLALVGRFASAIVHDLKNPLTIIGITAEVACKEETAPEARKASEQRINKQIRRITGMVNDILEFTKGSGAEMAVALVDYGAHVDSIMEELQPEVARKSIVIELPAAAPRIKLRLNPHRFSRVFYNLILNAVDEMPGGGRITVSFKVSDAEVITEIADTGGGIAPEIIGQLFEPFATHGKTKGTGLGLSITRKIIQEHGGRISARNQEGSGAVFTFALPIPKN